MDSHTHTHSTPNNSNSNSNTWTEESSHDGPLSLSLSLSLLYNECSMTTLASWGGGGGGGNETTTQTTTTTTTTSTSTTTQTTTTHVPDACNRQTRLMTVASCRFRRCCNCHEWGHYELECTARLRNPLLLHLAAETQTQLSLRLDQKRCTVSSRMSRCTMEADDSTKRATSCQKTRTSTTPQRCVLCERVSRPNKGVTCDGCGDVFHLECIPPLHEHYQQQQHYQQRQRQQRHDDRAHRTSSSTCMPDGPWFCVNCDTLDSYEDSNVDIEECQGVVVEQRKRRRTSASTMSTLTTPPRVERGTPNAWSDADVDTIDGFVVRSIADVARGGIGDGSSALTVPFPQESRFPVVLVSWFRSEAWGSLHDTASPMDSEASHMFVGVVLEVNAGEGMALVRNIPNWEHVFACNDNRIHISSCSLGEASWLRMSCLHVIVLPLDAPRTDRWCSESNSTLAHVDATILAKALGREEWSSHKGSREEEEEEDDDDDDDGRSGLSIDESKEASAMKTLSRGRTSGECMPKDEVLESLQSSSNDAGPGYAVEKIVDERKSGLETEFLIKWSNVLGEECSWEREANILNKNVVKQYKIERILDALLDTQEARDADTTTSRTVSVLRSGIEQMTRHTSCPDKRCHEGPHFVCPFCLARFGTYKARSAHYRRHLSEPNYLLIREAGRIASDDWYDKSRASTV